VKRTFLDALWPALLALFLYLPSVGDATVWDDHEFFQNENRIVNMSVRQAFTTDFWGSTAHPAVNQAGVDHISHYRPLALLAYSGVFRIFGEDPEAVHLTDVVLNALATFAFVYLLAGLGFDRKVYLTAAFLFAVHPIHVEAVAWMTGMTDTLAAAALLASLAFYVRGQNLLAATLAAIAMLMKESAIVAPALIILIEWRREPRFKRAFGAAAPYAALAAAYLVARALAIPSLRPGLTQTLFLTRYHLMPAIAGRYVAELFVPWPLAFCYDVHSRMMPALGFGIVALWVFVVQQAKSMRDDLLFAGGIAAICLAVPILASPLAIRLDVAVQDRYAYLASAGVCLLLAVVLRRIRRWVIVAILLIASFATLKQQQVWQSEEALWTHALKVTPSSSLASYELALKLVSLGRSSEALAVCQEGSRYHPEEKTIQDCFAAARQGKN